MINKRSKLNYELFEKVPEFLILHILSYMKNGWIYNRQKSLEMIEMGKNLRYIKTLISSLLLHTPLHLNRGIEMHDLVNREYIIKILKDINATNNFSRTYERDHIHKLLVERIKNHLTGMNTLTIRAIVGLEYEYAVDNYRIAFKKTT